MMRDKAVSLVLIVTLLSATVAVTGCASSTQITSDPSGAAVQVDGQPVGNTPANFSEDSVFVWTKHQVTLKKKGYHTYNGTMQATVSVLHLVLGIFCCLPLVIVGEFKPTYHYVLRKKEAADLAQKWLEVAQISFEE
jgi:hypothetical protein